MAPPPDGTRMRQMSVRSTEAMTTAMAAKIVVPRRPNTLRMPVASNGPSTKPLLPPMEKMLSPVPFCSPETLLAKRAPSG